MEFDFSNMEINVDTVVGIAAIISGILLHLSPMTLLIRVIKENSSQGLSSLAPFMIAQLNGVFSMCHPLMIKNKLALLGNVINCCIVGWYIQVLLFASPTNMARKRIGEFLVFLVVQIIFLFVSISMYERTGPLFNGSLATAFFIAICTKSLMMVIKKEEVEYMSSYTPVLLFLNGACLFAIGLLHQDIFFIISYGFACWVGAFQMYLVYLNNKDEKGKKKVD